MKIEPNLFLIARPLVKPRVFSHEKQRAAGDGTGERRRGYITERGRASGNFGGSGGMSALEKNYFTFRGGSGGRCGAFGHAFMGSAGHY